jgi:hypothetical protein
VTIEVNPRRLPRTARMLLIVLTTASAMLGAARHAGAVGNGALGIRPANESDFFHISLYPGAATDATAIVTNQTGSPTPLLNYAVDGTSTPEGRFTLASQQDPRRGVGAWARLNTDHITVPAKSELKVPFRLSVPVGTPPGDYAGGLIIQSPPQLGKTATVNGQTAVQLNVVQRQGVRIYLHVAGTASPQLQPETLTWRHTGKSLSFSLPLKNTGNTILHPTAALTISSRIGANTQIPFDTPESVLPGATIVLHARLADAPLIDVGHAEARVRSEAGATNAGAALRYAPLPLLAAAALLLAALLWCAWRLARFIRRARHALAHTAHAAPPPSSADPTPARSSLPATHRAPLR